MITVNGIEIKPTIFPDNTSQVWKLPDEILKAKYHEIVWGFTHEGEIMHLIQLVQLIREIGSISCTLHFPYLPYARQDKGISNETTFALSVFAVLINKLRFSKVTALDPHSNTAQQYFDNFTPIYPKALVKKVYDVTKSEIVAYADGGACEKYTKLYKFKNFMSAFKHRDSKTGKITQYEVIGDCDGKNVLIVDDICDGGATFVLLAQQLKEMGAKEINLFVTHGIFSQGAYKLKDAGIKRIFTAKGELNSYFENNVYKEIK